jgi:hypothetical protein
MTTTRAIAVGICSFVVAGLTLAGGLAATGAGSTNSRPSASSKQDFLAREQAREQALNKLPHAAKHPEQLPATSCPHSPKPGIGPFRLGPFHGGKNLVNEAVAISSRGLTYTLYTGARDDAPTQGIILVLLGSDPCAEAAGTKPTYLKAYQTPYQEGAVIVVEIQADSVLFTTTRGHAGRFNYVTGQFS